MKLECVDCRATVTGETMMAIETMAQHVRQAHNRDMAFDAGAYVKPTKEMMLASALLLDPHLIGAA